MMPESREQESVERPIFSAVAPPDIFDPDRPPIQVEGARVHNLKNISLDLPRNRITVITGPSGSGKSSLADDTIFAEGQRQYIESLSVYSRQFLHQMERPDVDSIRGLQPTISIDQRGASRNPRSTVATITEIYDYLRVLYSRIGLAHCYCCGRPIRQQTPEEILAEILTIPESTRIILMAPVVRGRKGQHKETLRQMIKAGFVRARIDGALVEIEKIPDLDPQKTHDIEVVVDRLVLREGMRPRLFESLKLALKQGEGLAFCLYEKERMTTPEGTTRSVWKEILFSTLYCCPRCKINYLELAPRTFSFNSPYGVCPECQGLGTRDEFDPELFAPDLSLPPLAGGFLPVKAASASALKSYRRALTVFAERFGIDPESPMADWEKETRNIFFYGDPQAKTGLNDALAKPGASAENPSTDGQKAKNNAEKSDASAAEERLADPNHFPGFVSLLDDIYRSSRSRKERTFLETFRGPVRCRACEGSRIRPEAKSVTVAGRRIHELTALTVEEALDWFRNAGKLLPTAQEMISRPMIEQILERLDFMNRVGLNYLTLDRASDTLSGGELQRVRLATGLGSGLVGVCYILDEPSVGLHPRDNGRLIDAMRELQRRGNTVLVVEHDEAVMRQADWLVDLGPGAGHLGGQILDQGRPEEVAARGTSPTGRFLGGVDSIPVPKKRRRIVKSRSLTIDEVTTNNLKGVTATFPLGTLICVTGVSGSGKSSLLNETLVPALARRLGGGGPKPGGHKGLRGVSRIDKLIQIDQSPIGRSPRSNPATYCGVFDEIRKVFAQSKDAKRLGYQAGRFSFNVAGGRCEECQGQGVRKIEMHFLPDMYAVCPVCEGKRFNHQTLAVKYKDKSIADVLDMPVEEAIEFFANFTSISRLLEGLRKVGLGYLPLGQASTTLSGGEAQRIKLAAELARVETGNTLYVLDEPTCGLHAGDVRQLLEVLSHLVDLGNTVIVIEHNLDVMKTADWIIDLGPEGGAHGGEITFAGTPEQIAEQPDNYTGRYLKPLLVKKTSSKKTASQKD